VEEKQTCSAVGKFPDSNMACKCRTCGQNFDSANKEVGPALNRTLCPVENHNGPFDIIPQTSVPSGKSYYKFSFISLYII
jgi:hypothetical protein